MTNDQKYFSPSSWSYGQHLINLKPGNVNGAIDEYDYIFPNADNSANPVHLCAHMHVLNCPPAAHVRACSHMHFLKVLYWACFEPTMVNTCQSHLYNLTRESERVFAVRRAGCWREKMWGPLAYLLTLFSCLFFDIHMHALTKYYLFVVPFKYFNSRFMHHNGFSDRANGKYGNIVYL